MRQKQETVSLVALLALMVAAAVGQRLSGQTATATRPAAVPAAAAPAPHKSAMNNPFRMLEGWPHLGDIKPGAAIGIIPDGKGGVWLQHRSNPAIVHIDASGNIVKRFEVTFSQAHGMCQDRDGNFWALDSGPFNDAPDAGIKGNQVFKYNQEGKLLLTLGKAGVMRAGTDTFIAPSACVITPAGDIIIADGHWPRPSKAQPDGDRLVWFTKDGKFIKSFGKLGTAPGEFMGPHSLAFDSQGRLFVADRSNNRVQIFDKDMNFVDDWKQFGRPSGVWILKDDTLIVSDSESVDTGFVPAEFKAKNPDSTTARNAGWQNGIRIGSAKDGSFRYFIPDTRPEGLAADELGNVFGGLTSGCETSRSGGCLQKYIKK